MEIIRATPDRWPELNTAIGEFVTGLVWGGRRNIAHYRSFGVFDKGTLIAGVLYHNWDPDTGVIELTSASTSKRWLTRPVLKAMFALPFDELGCQMAALRVSEHNKPMLRIARAYGFEAYRIPRLRGRDEAEIILTLTDDAWHQSRFHAHEMMRQSAAR